MIAARVVIDTNVLVSALLNDTGTPAKILRLVTDREIIIVINDEIIHEYDDVLSREKLDIDPDDKIKILAFFREVAMHYEPERSTIEIPDEDDRVFFDTADQLGISLITGNTRHFPDKSFVMTPAEFLIRLKKTSV